MNAQDIYGKTPLDYQQRSAAEEIEQILLEQGGQYGYSQTSETRILNLLDQVRLAEGEKDMGRLHALLESDLPANGVLSIRLLNRLASHISRTGDPVEAVITAPLQIGGRLTVAAGEEVEGTVMNVQRASNRYQQAQLEIEFCNLVHGGGARTRISSVLTRVDNAREQVYKGQIIGISFPHAFSERLSWGFRIVGITHPLLAQALNAAVLAWQKEYSREIILEPGADMFLKILAPEKLKKLPGGLVAAAAVPPALAGIIQQFPIRAATPNNIPSDLINILILGSRTQLEAAFEEAGWLQAQKLSLTSGIKTFASLAEQKGYKEAPVSALLLDGKKPDLVYQKQTNTFAKRHHIRVWKYAQSYQDREMWLASATHDIGIGVLRGGTQWIHRIDPEIDRELAKVKDDLLFTEGVEWFSLIERPAVPWHTMNATGDEIRTEGKLLILSMR
jgi:hypothetical protein